MTIRIHKNIPFDTYIVAFWLFYGFCGQFLIKFPATTIKIASLVSVFLLYFVEHRRIAYKERMILFSVGFMSWYLLDNILHDGLNLGIQWSTALISWILPVTVVCIVHRNINELRLFMKVVVFSTFVFSLILLSQNEWLSSAGEMTIGVQTINRNKVIDSTAPGLVLVLIKMVITRQYKFPDVIVAGVIFLACLQPNSRAMFAALVLSILCLVISIWKDMRNSRGMKKVFIVVVLVILAAAILFLVLPSSYTDRLWHFNSYTLENSNRLHLWRKAIEITDRPIVGMGAHYYAEYSGEAVGAYGSHNLFIDLYVSSGLVAVFFMINALRECLCFDWYLLSLAAIPFIRMTVEAGRGYGVWGVVVLLYILGDIAQQKSISVEEVIRNICMER